MTNTLTQPANTRASHWTGLERFLLLGSEDGTWSVTRRALHPEQAFSARTCIAEDGLRVVESVLRAAHRVPSHDPALLVLALAASPAYTDARTNAAALAALPEVAATGAQLGRFVEFAETQRGWGRGLRSAVADWYLRKPVSELAREFAVRSHRELLRNAHPKPVTASQNALFQWAVEGTLGHLATPDLLSGDLRLIHAVELVRAAAGEDEVVRIIEDYRLPHNLVPASWKKSARVWEALLHSLSYCAMLKHLDDLTSASLLAALVVARLMDRRRIANSRVHPVTVFLAWQKYQRSEKALSSVIDALEEAFHISLANVEPPKRRIRVSGCSTEAAVLAMCLDSSIPRAARLAEVSAALQPVDALVIVNGSADSIAITARNPNDPLELAIAGFDARVPGLIAEFIGSA